MTLVAFTYYGFANWILAAITLAPFAAALGLTLSSAFRAFGDFGWRSWLAIHQGAAV